MRLVIITSGSVWVASGSRNSIKSSDYRRDSNEIRFNFWLKKDNNEGSSQGFHLIRLGEELPTRNGINYDEWKVKESLDWPTFNIFSRNFFLLDSPAVFIITTVIDRSFCSFPTTEELCESRFGRALPSCASQSDHHVLDMEKKRHFIKRRRGLRNFIYRTAKAAAPWQWPGPGQHRTNALWTNVRPLSCTLGTQERRWSWPTTTRVEELLRRKQKEDNVAHVCCKAI